MTNSTIKILNTDSGYTHKVSVGPYTYEFMERQTHLDSDAKDSIINEAADILGHCIKAGDKGNITNIAVGYIQSGKTLSFTTLTALAADNGYRMIIYLTGTKTNLQSQTAERLKSDLNLVFSRTYKIYTDLKDKTLTNNINNFLKLSDKILLLPILKHYVHINTLAGILENCKDSLENKGVLIIDDEADQSSFNTHAKAFAKNNKKNKEDDYSKTYGSIIHLKRAVPNHSYIQYTATPQAAFLIDNMDILSPKYYTVLSPGKGYTGGKVFFKDRISELIVNIPDSDVPTKSNVLTQMPESLKDALMEFLVSVAICVYIEKKQQFLSMMIHIDGTHEKNETYHKWTTFKIQSWLDIITSEDGDPGKSAIIESFNDAYNKITKYLNDAPSFSEVKKYLKEVLIDTKLHLVQSNQEKEIKWDSNTSHILVGADMLNRGFTIEKLSMTYMPRHAKGKSTADTIEQRCRFFGYKSSYIDICRVYLPIKSINDYVDYVDHEEALRISLKECKSIEEFTKNPKSMLIAKSLNPTRTNILSKELIRNQLRGWKQLRTILCRDENKPIFQNFLSKWSDEEFTLFKDYGGNVIRNHRYITCPIEVFIDFFKEVQYMDILNITKKIVTIQYLYYLKDDKGINNVTIFEMAYGAKQVSDLRTRGMEKDGEKTINLQAGPADNGSYDGDTEIKFDNQICIQIHHIAIKAPLSVLNNQDLYNLAIFYPECYYQSVVNVGDK